MVASLLEVVRALAAETDSRRVLAALAEGARTVTGAPAALVAATTPGPSNLVTEAVAGLPEAALPAPPLLVARACAGRRTEVADDLRLPGAPALRHGLAVPLVHEGRALGAVLVAAPAPLAEEAAHALDLLAAHAAMALAHAIMASAAARRLARSEEHGVALARVGEAGSTSAVIERALDVATTLFGADHALFLTVDEREDITHAWGRRISREYITTIGKGYRQSAGGVIFRVGAPVYIADVATDPRTRLVHELARDEGLHSTLLVPLLTGGRGLGAIALYWDVVLDIEPAEIALVRSFSTQVAVALAAAAERERVARRLAGLELLAQLIAATAAGPGAAGGEARATRGVELLARQLPSVWLFRRTAGGALATLAHAGPSALDPRIPEAAALAALETRAAVTHPVAGSAPLLAEPLPAAGAPDAALVAAVPPPEQPVSRAGTLFVELVRAPAPISPTDELVRAAAAHLEAVLRC